MLLDPKSLSLGKELPQDQKENLQNVFYEQKSCCKLESLSSEKMF